MTHCFLCHWVAKQQINGQINETSHIVQKGPVYINQVLTVCSHYMKEISLRVWLCFHICELRELKFMISIVPSQTVIL